MASVYTQRLALVQGLSVITDVLTVPEGTQAVFTCVNWVTGLNAGQPWASLVHVATGARFAAAQGDLAGTTDYYNQTIEGRWAFYAGETIAAETDGVSSWDLLVTGYLLTLP